MSFLLMLVTNFAPLVPVTDIISHCYTQHIFFSHISGEIASEWQDMDPEEAGSKEKFDKLMALVNVS